MSLVVAELLDFHRRRMRFENDTAELSTGEVLKRSSKVHVNFNSIYVDMRTPRGRSRGRGEANAETAIDKGVDSYLPATTPARTKLIICGQQLKPVLNTACTAACNLHHRDSRNSEQLLPDEALGFHFHVDSCIAVCHGQRKRLPKTRVGVPPFDCGGHLFAPAAHGYVRVKGRAGGKHTTRKQVSPFRYAGKTLNSHNENLLFNTAQIPGLKNNNCQAIRHARRLVIWCCDRLKSIVVQFFLRANKSG